MINTTVSLPIRFYLNNYWVRYMRCYYYLFFYKIYNNFLCLYKISLSSVNDRNFIIFEFFLIIIYLKNLSVNLLLFTSLLIVLGLILYNLITVHLKPNYKIFNLNEILNLNNYYLNNINNNLFDLKILFLLLSVIYIKKLNFINYNINNLKLIFFDNLNE